MSWLRASEHNSPWHTALAVMNKDRSWWVYLRHLCRRKWPGSVSICTDSNLAVRWWLWSSRVEYQRQCTAAHCIRHDTSINTISVRLRICMLLHLNAGSSTWVVLADLESVGLWCQAKMIAGIFYHWWCHLMACDNVVICVDRNEQYLWGFSDCRASPSFILTSSLQKPV